MENKLVSESFDLVMSELFDRMVSDTQPDRPIIDFLWEMLNDLASRKYNVNSKRHGRCVLSFSKQEILGAMEHFVYIKNQILEDELAEDAK
jgi:hypothetical protein